jgi:hypothetical protein
MLKIFEVSDVKKQQNGDHFTFGHLAWTLPVLFAGFRSFLEFLHLRLKILAKIIDNTENFDNFVRYKYTHVFCYYLFDNQPQKYKI